MIRQDKQAPVPSVLLRSNADSTGAISCGLYPIWNENGLTIAHLFMTICRDFITLQLFIHTIGSYYYR
ncbi:hypothetical protein QT711_04950 [Sporosarcina saromensis]|uniref:Uncharacterized protein n=1 Tax=Sporosarcina saromensis TaxID=359365 RepID=A0ABU4G6E1_9BACL|nr:hypothetical protein [Sporosarcina saromensis]